MARDGVANIVNRLQERGFDPRRVGHDSWESRCPAHRSVDRALSITRNEHNHVELKCRSTENCQHSRIVGALGITNEHMYGETPDWLIGRLSGVPIQPASFASPDAKGKDGPGTSVAEGTTGLADGRISGASGVTVEVPSVEQAAAGAMLLPEQGIACGTVIGASSEKPDRQSSVRVLTRLASSARLFRSADGHFCAQVRVGDRFEIYGLRSAGLRDWLIDGYMIDQPEPPSNWAIRRVVGMLEAKARFTTGMPEVFVRVGQGGDGADPSYFLDLGDSSGRAVAIRDHGWIITDKPDVYFRRPAGLLPLPLPEGGGSIDLLRPYVNLTEPDFRLMIAWLTAALRPVGPYPVLVLNGEQASGKSTLARILRLLIDPQTSPALALPSSTENLMTTAVNGWLLAYENLSAIPDWFSDCVCQLAFGGGFASRTLFTNDERSVIYAQRPVILVGIADFVMRGDLRDRSVFLHLTPIPDKSRRTERTFWPAFRADYPRILGGVLDAIVGGLRELPSVDLKELPRMADYAEWGESTGRGLGWGAGAFLSAYNVNRKEATEAVLEDSPVATVLLTAARNGIHWSGRPLELYGGILKITGNAPGPSWPKTVHAFGNELRRVAPQLRLNGLSIDFERRRGERIVILRSEGATTH